MTDQLAAEAAENASKSGAATANAPSKAPVNKGDAKPDSANSPVPPVKQPASETEKKQDASALDQKREAPAVAAAPANENQGSK